MREGGKGVSTWYICLCFEVNNTKICSDYLRK